MRARVRIILPTGQVVEESKAVGIQLIRRGQAILVPQEARFTVRMLKAKEIETTP